MLPPPDRLIVFLAAAITLILAPGPDTVYVLTRGASRGVRTGRLAALGIATGVIIHTTAVALGLAAVLRAYPGTVDVVKYAGAVYLLYLSFDTLRNRGQPVPPGDTVDIGGPDAYLRGVAVNVLNPKVALFFLAFLPGFAPDGSASTMLALGGIYAALTAVYLGAIGSVSGTAGDLFGGDGRLARWLDGAAGLALLGLAALLAFG